MTRDEILTSYKVSEHGRIVSPGQFEGEMVYVPYFWDMVLNGLSNMEFDDDDTRIDVFTVNDDDRKMFPELGDTVRLRLWESEQGFVYVEEFSAIE